MKRLLFLPVILGLLILVSSANACPFQKRGGCGLLGGLFGGCYPQQRVYQPHCQNCQQVPVVTRQVVPYPEQGHPVPVLVDQASGQPIPAIKVPVANVPRFVRITTPDGRTEVFELIAQPKAGTTPAPQAKGTEKPAKPTPVPIPSKPGDKPGKAIPQVD